MIKIVTIVDAVLTHNVYGGTVPNTKKEKKKNSSRFDAIIRWWICENANNHRSDESTRFLIQCSMKRGQRSATSPNTRNEWICEFDGFSGTIVTMLDFFFDIRSTRDKNSILRNPVTKVESNGGNWMPGNPRGSQLNAFSRSWVRQMNYSLFRFVLFYSFSLSSYASSIFMRVFIFSLTVYIYFVRYISFLRFNGVNLQNLVQVLYPGDIYRHLLKLLIN